MPKWIMPSIFNRFNTMPITLFTQYLYPREQLHLLLTGDTASFYGDKLAPYSNKYNTNTLC